MIFEEEIGRVKGHFGPINNLKFHPNGRRLYITYTCTYNITFNDLLFYSYSSGGEDGYVRVHNFDPSYFEFEMDY